MLIRAISALAALSLSVSVSACVDGTDETETLSSTSQAVGDIAADMGCIEWVNNVCTANQACIIEDEYNQDPIGICCTVWTNGTYECVAFDID